MGLDQAEMGMEAYPDDFPRTAVSMSGDSESVLSVAKEAPQAG
jgi:hypothetical protein